MTNKHGDFIWYELMIGDVGAAQQFYGPLLGWDFAKSGAGDMAYREILVDGNPIGGLMALTREMTESGAEPCWLGYITVEDVDRMAEAIESAGGSVHLSPRDIPEVGRFALVTDPTGAMFYVMKPIPPADDPDFTSMAFAATEPMLGHCAWNELASSDPERALNFYHDLFGWEKDGEMDMGPVGKYEFLRHDHMIGAIMPKAETSPASAWTFYFRVADIDAAASRIEQERGTILQPPIEIPGGDYALIARDPQAARFALVGARHGEANS